MSFLVFKMMIILAIQTGKKTDDLQIICCFNGHNLSQWPYVIYDFLRDYFLPQSVNYAEIYVFELVTLAPSKASKVVVEDVTWPKFLIILHTSSVGMEPVPPESNLTNASFTSKVMSLFSFVSKIQIQNVYQRGICAGYASKRGLGSKLHDQKWNPQNDQLGVKSKMTTKIDNF